MAGMMRRRYQELSEAQQRRITLPMRWSGSLPGGAVAAPAQYLSAVTAVECILRGITEHMERSGVVLPFALAEVVASL